EALSKHEGDYLILWGLTALSDAAAESLSKHKGKRLDLGGLTSLTDTAADSLSKHNGKINWEDPAEWADSLREG
ncbi:hypothetical protein N9496_07300, partial [Akkermansiaceae bacterium]|nr:hypothetical protein [Akkermansiaceae bacterium]